MRNSTRIILVLISLIIFSSLSAQEKDSKFEIKFFNDRGAIAMISTSGCSWSNLVIKKKYFYLNQFGMVNFNNNTEALKNSTFLFFVEKKNNKVHLKAYKGTEWKDLSFDLPKDKNNPVIIDDSNILEKKV